MLFMHEHFNDLSFKITQIFTLSSIRQSEGSLVSNQFRHPKAIALDPMLVNKFTLT